MPATDNNHKSAQDRLEDHIQAELRFLSHFSHEFRTPLAVMQTTLDVLRQYSDRLSPEQQAQRLDKLQRQLHLLVDMLAHTRLIRELELEYRLKPVQVNVSNLLHDIIREQTDQSEAGYENVFDITCDDTSCHILADERLLREALLQIVRNAYQYRAPGSDVRCHVSGNSEGIQCRVGNAIVESPPQNIASWFNMFQRGARSASIPGNGLGLAVVMAVVDAHGGHVTHSITGQYYEIVITLPRTPM